MCIPRRRFLTLFLALSLLLIAGPACSSPASAEGLVINKVLTTVSSTPVALVDPALITVSTSTDGCSIVSAAWYDANGKAVSGAFNIETYLLEIVLSANADYVFAPDVACYLNNSAITSSVSDDRKTVVLTRSYTADVWAPTVYKNPGAETVDEGGWASFVVSASYARDYEWNVVDPSGYTVIPVSDLKNYYSEMDYTGDGSTKLILYHIPYELDGWKVVCDFIGAGVGNVTRSQPALLTVRPSPSRVVATPTPSPAVSAAPTPTLLSSTTLVDPAPVTQDDAGQEPVHEHHFSDTWHYDARGHWRECPDDGAAADEALHSFVWTEIQPETDTEAGIEQGVCEVCGYTTRRYIGGPPSTDTADSSASSGSGIGGFLTGLLPSGSSDTDGGSSVSLKPPGALMIFLMALLPIDLIWIIIHLSGPARQRRRRRRR